jgi:uncharacterized protein (TIGR04141 family)
MDYNENIDALLDAESPIFGNNKKFVNIYRLNCSHFEIKHLKTTSEKIKIIISKHKQNNEDIVEDDLDLIPILIGDLNYLLYTYSLNDKQSIWNSFLPNHIRKEDLISSSPSLVLFIYDDTDIFCLIGGHGTQVIKRFLDDTFGLDLFSRIVDENKDLILSAKYRGMTGNLAGGAEVYRNEQKLNEIVTFGRLFKEIVFEINEINRKEFFHFIGDPKENTLSCIANSSFLIKSGISFDQTHQLIEKIIEIIKIKPLKSLGTFSQIKDLHKINNNYMPSLYEKLRDDMVIEFKQGGYKDNLRFDFDFGHPSNFLEFYECDKYIVTIKDGKKSIIVETTKRENIYKETMKYLSEQESIVLLVDFMRVLGGTIVHGHRDNKKPIKAPFIQYISCEITDENGRPLFYLDNKWLRVENTFIDELNSTCHSMMTNSRLNKNILPEKWKDAKNIDEDTYNLTYLGKQNYIVLDKILGQNIELCDILYFEDNELFVIHVKKGFNAKMRDLTNQIKISSQRLWNDVRTDQKFLEEIYAKYKASQNYQHNTISEADFLNLFKYKINYVLAFTSTLKDYKPIYGNLEKVKSNIAKFSLIQSLTNSTYPISVVEIVGEK